MPSYEIPLTPAAQQFFIPLAGATYSLTLKWCGPAGCWMLDIATDTGSPLLYALPVVTGVDLLGQHKHLGIAGALYAETDTDLFAPPSYSNLGVTGHIYFVTP